MKKSKRSFILTLACLIAVFFIVPAVTAGAKVNINTAPKAELVTLKYVGEAIAGRIIEYRNAHPFESPEEIMEVKGVGPKIYEANKDRIVVENE